MSYKLSVTHTKKNFQSFRIISGVYCMSNIVLSPRLLTTTFKQISAINARSKEYLNCYKQASELILKILLLRNYFLGIHPNLFLGKKEILFMKKRSYFKLASSFCMAGAANHCLARNGKEVLNRIHNKSNFLVLIRALTSQFEFTYCSLVCLLRLLF